MKMPSPSYSVKLLAFALPIAVLATLAALIGAGGIPQIGPLPDVLAYVLELAPKTLILLAAFGCASVAMNISGINIDNARRYELMNDAARGNRGALYVLIQEGLAWLAFTWLALWAYLAQG